jgi:ADP-ribose pyrophosphatase YjhB (NUDIX family)
MALALSTFRLLPAWLRRAVIRVISPTYVVGVVAVIRNEASELLLLRERHHYGWALPGGLLGRREEPADAIARELREEIGLVLTAADLAEPLFEIDVRARRVDVIFKLAADPNMRPQAQEPEVLEARWFAVDELPELFEPAILMLQTAGVLPANVDE